MTPSSPRGGAPGRSAIWISLALSLLLNLRQVAYLALLENRYMVHWQRADGVALILSISVAAGAIFAVHELLARSRWRAVRRLRSPFLALALLSGVISTLSYLSVSARTLSLAWVAGLGLGVVPSFFGTDRVHRAFCRVGLVLSPVSLVTFAQLLWWSPWGAEPDPLDARGEARPGATPVYFLLFDGWSYERSTERGEFQPLFRGLRSLASRSIVFRNAFSPTADTETSLPRLLFDKDGSWRIQKEGNTVYWERRGERMPTQRSASIFSPFARAGYRTALIGFYLPYRRLMGDGVEVVRTTPNVPKGRDLGERLRIRTLASARFLVGPTRRAFFRELYNRRYSRYWFGINQEIFRDVVRVMGDWPDNTFLFAHWPTPHAPFVFNADGSYRGPFRERRMEGDPSDYQRSLENLDRIIAEIVSRLQEMGRFDRCLLILTSDHGWKKRDRVPLRVPLLVKWPHQRTARVVSPPFPTTALGGLLERFARGGMRIDEALRYLDSRTIEIP